MYKIQFWISKAQLCVLRRLHKKCRFSNDVDDDDDDVPFDDDDGDDDVDLDDDKSVAHAL